MNDFIAIGKGVQAAALKKEIEPKFDQLRKATQSFESLFAKKLLAGMRAGMKDSLEQGPGADIYRDMMDQALADRIGQTEALGIGKMLYRDFAPKLLELEKQRMIADVRNGRSDLPKDKQWILGDLKT